MSNKTSIVRKLKLQYLQRIEEDLPLEKTSSKIQRRTTITNIFTFIDT